MNTLTRTDPIDELIPPSRPLIVRLLIGIGVVGVVGLLSALVGLGFVYPQPDCCGSGGGSSMMLLADEGESVAIVTWFFNSSGRELRIDDAEVDLPGARVLDVQLARDQDGPVLPIASLPLPATVGGHELVRVVVTFVPERCSGPDDVWGEVDLDLEVVNGWLPSFGRTFRLPDPVVEVGRGTLSVLPPNDDPALSSMRDPLAAACALLAAV